MTIDTAKMRAETLARMENARRDDCLDRMVPSDLRILLGHTLRLLDEIERLRDVLGRIEAASRHWADYEAAPDAVHYAHESTARLARAALAEGGPDDR